MLNSRLPNSKGRVYLIGAGPGDPELLTLRAVRAIGEADVVLIDDLVDERCLAHARPEARIVRVGKRAGCASTPQVFIERLMVHLAKRGSVVARLKGGDPFIFGRGGEELAAVRAAGLDVQVVPGITAGAGVAAELGIPLTLRGTARAVTFLTGHGGAGAADWAALRAARATIVVYMGLAHVREIAAAMLAAGFAPLLPACAAQDGTLASRRTVFAPLATLADAVEEARLAAPVLLIVGEVVGAFAVHARAPRTLSVRSPRCERLTNQGDRMA